MRAKHFVQLAGVVLAILSGASAMAQNQPERILYLSGIHTLDGYLYKPKGPGPFPSVVFNQPSANSLPANPKPFPKLAEVFTSQGYAFFVPGRHSFGSEGQQNNVKNDQEDRQQKLMRQHEKQASHIVAAITWLKAQKFIDESRVAIFGEAAGGVSTLFMTNKDLGLNGIILASPGTQALKENPDMPARLQRAVAEAKAPIFLIQTQSDMNLLPSEILGPEIAKKGRPNHVKVYPRFGQKQGDGQRFIMEGYALWQEDVFTFLKTVTERAGALRETN